MPRQRSTIEDSDSNMPDQVKSAVEYGMEQTKKLAKEILPLCDPESRREMEEKLTDRFKRLVRAQLVYEESSRIVNDVVEEIEKQESSRDVLKSCDFLQTESQKRIEDFQSSITENMIVTNKAFEAFRKELQNIMREQETESEGASEEDEEEEEAAASSSSSAAAPKTKGRKKRGGKSAFELQPDEMETDEDAGGDGSSEDVEGEGIIDEFMPKLDPFCKKPIVEPVRNKFCKHVYDRQTTLEWLNEHPRTKCPYQGCTNPKILQVAHFVEDAETTEQVARARARGRRRGGRK